MTQEPKEASAFTMADLDALIWLVDSGKPWEVYRCVSCHTWSTTPYRCKRCDRDAVPQDEYLRGRE